MKITGFKDTIEWYNQNAQYYAKEADKVDTSEHINEFVALLPKHANILDAGCGDGRDSGRIAERGFSVTGYDISAGLLEIARKHHPDVKFIEGDLRTLPFKSESFDGIWVYASLLHLEKVEDVQKALRECYRVLQPGGIIYGCVKKQTGNIKIAVVTDSVSKHDRFFQYFTEQEIQELLKASGFDVLKTIQDDDLQGRAEVKWIIFIGKKTEILDKPE